MTTELFGVYMDNTKAPWVAIVGEPIRAYATTLGTFEGSDDTDSNGRFVLTGLTDRDDWVPVASKKGGIVILEAIATADVLQMLTDQTLHVAELEADGLVSVDGETINVIDDFDAVIDANYAGSSPSVFNAIQAAVNFGAISIWLKLADDTSSITIASGDKVQRLQGKDADTTTVPVDITCNKDDVTFEQLNFDAGADLTIGGGADGDTIRNCLYSAASILTLGDGSNESASISVEDTRFLSNSNGALQIKRAVNSLSLSRLRFQSPTAAANSILITLGANQTLTGLIVSDLRFISTEQLTDYVMRVTGSGSSRIFSSLISGVQMPSIGAEGGLDLLVVTTHLSDMNLTGIINLTSGKRVLKVTSPAGQDIDTLISNSRFGANQTSDVVFECASADSDAAGLVLYCNTFTGGTVLGSQDAMWIGNNMAGRTIDFQSKTGIVVIGGDMTGATLSNLADDTILRHVKGQADRGPFRDGDNSVSDVEPAVQAERNTTLSVANNTVTPVDMTIQAYDNDSMVEFVTNPSRVTFTTAGKYHITMVYQFATNTTGLRLVRMLLNGTTIIAEWRGDGAAAGFTVGQVSTSHHMAATDYVELVVFQTSGGNLNSAATGEGLRPIITAERIGSYRA